MFYQSKIFRGVRIFLIILSVILATACTSIPRVPVSLTVTSKPNINSGPSLTALPVRVRVYQLRDINEFKDATFKELWKMDKSILGDSFISVKELTITPASKQKLKISRDEDTQYIGVVALFRKPQLSKWRVYKRVDWQAKSLISAMNIYVAGNTIGFR